MATNVAQPLIPSDPADDVYPVGFLRRSPFGYCWQESPPEGRSVLGRWLVPVSPPAASYDVAPLIRPPRGAAFLRRFADLVGPDEVLAFANRYGSLGDPSGEPLEFWQQEVASVRDLAGTLDEATRAAARDTTAEPLSARFRRRADCLGDEVVYAYGTRELAFDPKIAQEHGYRASDQISTDWMSVKALVRFARLCVQTAIERHLRGAHVGVRYDHDRPAPQPPQLVPATLLGAVYLELDRKLRSPLRTLPLKQCDQCGREFQPKRRSAAFCGATCRKDRWRLLQIGPATGERA